jgi:hypothetical protein
MELEMTPKLEDLLLQANNASHTSKLLEELRKEAKGKLEADYFSARILLQSKRERQLWNLIYPLLSTQLK